MNRQVVVTGMGMITPIGLDLESSWSSLINGKSGVQTIDNMDHDLLTNTIAAQVRNFNPELADISSKDVKKMDVFIQFALAAAKEAFENSGLTPDQFQSERAGCILGSGVAGIPEIERSKEKLMNKGRLSPFFVPAIIANLAPGHIAIRHNLKGPNHAVVSACASGTHAVGEAYRAIKHDYCDVVVTGGTESAITPMTVNGFNAMKALSRRKCNPIEASRPFDRDRDGFVIAEGAGVLILEEYEHAKKRGAFIYGEVLGYGTSCDAFHMTNPQQEGAISSMQNAINDSGLSASAIDYINAHGTSTKANDLNETNAVKQVFKNHAKELMMSSNKSMIGHCLGAAGAIEAIFTLLTINRSIVPPTINLENLDEGCDLDYVPGMARETKVTRALSNSFGFGGTNGTLIFSKI